MPSIIELHKSQEETADDNPSATLLYRINDTTSKETAQLTLRTFAPATYQLISSGQTLVRQSTHVEPAGHDWWWGQAKYGRRKQKAINESRFTFDTTGGMTHITQSIETTAKAGINWGGAPNCDGAIGLANGRDVEGCDIYIPIHKWTETHYLPVVIINDAYKLVIKHLTARTNNAPWRNHNANEVLFLGAVGSQRGEDDWEITYQFAADEKVVGLQPWHMMPAIDKGPWEYYWLMYEDVTSNNRLVKRPNAHYSEKVYYDGNFGALMIG